MQFLQDCADTKHKVSETIWTGDSVMIYNYNKDIYTIGSQYHLHVDK